jgi:hypothetical protein
MEIDIPLYGKISTRQSSLSYTQARAVGRATFGGNRLFELRREASISRAAAVRLHAGTA